MTLFLGIDGGGTKTSCAVGDNTKILGMGTWSGANIVRLGVNQARVGIQTAILKACREAGRSPEEIAHTCIGAAGVSVPGVRDTLRQLIAEVVPSSITVVGDHDLAFEAAFGSEPGVIVASGTGSIACGRNRKGQDARAGGHGFAISDEGSGHCIGRTAVSLTMRSIDRGETTCLYDLILAAWRVEPADLVRTANAIPAPDFAKLFPVVVHAEKEGDRTASTVLQQAGTELAELARAVIDRLWAHDEMVRVGMVGGVFKNSAVIRAQFASTLRTLHAAAEIQMTVADPLVGALALARKCAPLG